MGFFSSFFEAPAATISNTINAVASNPVIAGQAAIVNMGIEKVTGLTPTEQYAVGAAGGTAQGALWVASPTAAASVSSTVGSGLALAGTGIGAGLAGAGLTGGSGAATGSIVTGLKTAASAAAAKAVSDSQEKKEDAPRVTPIAEEKKNDILPMLAIGVGLLSALN